MMKIIGREGAGETGRNAIHRKRKEVQRATQDERLVFSDRRNPSVGPVMKPVRGFGPGHPRCRSSPHSHRPPPPGSPRNAPVRSILLTRHRCTRSARYRSTCETGAQTDGRAVGPKVRPAPGNHPFSPFRLVTPRRNTDTWIHDAG